jgi:hypothetical protein
MFREVWPEHLQLPLAAGNRMQCRLAQAPHNYMADDVPD